MEYSILLGPWVSARAGDVVVSAPQASFLVFTYPERKQEAETMRR